MRLSGKLEFAIALGVLALAALALSPSLVTGYWGEDTYYSIIVRGSLVLNGESIFDSLIGYEKHNFHVGRFYPATPLIITSVFYTIRDVVAYKGYLIAMTVLDISLFLMLVRKLGGSRGFAGFAGCVVVGLFQFRIFIDPILGYYGQIQWMTAGVFLSLIALLNYLEGRGRRWLALSVGVYLLACLTYEVAYTLVALHLILIVSARRQWKTSVGPSLPFLGVVGVCGTLSFAMRRLYPGNLYLQNPRLDWKVVAEALARQTTSALPLSYWTCDPLKIFEHGRIFEGPADTQLVIAVLLSLGLSYLSLRRGVAMSRARAGLVIVFGLILAVFPAVLIAISPYHQNYLTFGVGWISVLTQYFGVALVLAVGLWSLVALPGVGGSFARGKCLAASILVASVVGLTYRANVEVAACFNASPGTPRFRAFAGQHGAAWHLPRLNMEAALDSGLMDEVPATSSVQVFQEYPYWHNPEYGSFFYAKHANKRLIVAPPSASLPASPTYQVRDLFQGASSGFVVLSVVDQDTGNLKRRGLRIFIRNPDVFRSVINVVDPNSGLAFRPGRDLPLIGSGRDWALFSLEPTAGRANPDTLQVVDASTGVAWVGDGQGKAIAGRDRLNLAQ